jgi:hypothetical protein
MRLDCARGELCFAPPSGGPMRVAARRVFTRGQPPPCRVYAIVHLTDIVARTPVSEDADSARLARALHAAAHSAIVTADGRASRPGCAQQPSPMILPLTGAPAAPVAVACALAGAPAYADVELGGFTVIPHGA